MTSRKRRRYLSTGSEWNFELLAKYDKRIGEAAAHYKLDTYPNQIEIITAEQMMDAYCLSACPSTTVTGRSANNSLTLKEL